MKFLNNLNMSQNEVQNAVIQNLASAPANPRSGQLYWDTTNKKLYVYNGTDWVDATSQGKTYVFSDGLTESGSTIKVNYGSENPKANGTATPGTATTVSRSDHVHPIDTTRASAQDLTAHIGNTSNPHNVTKEQVGLDNVTNDAQVKRSEMGVANGVATLDGDAKIPLAQLPDAVLGQLVYGGNVNAEAIATLTNNAKKKLGTTSDSIQLTNNTAATTGYVANEGVYYIATAAFTFAGITFESGDWLISTGSEWTKIDTSDAVTGVKGDKEATYRRGNVNLTPDNIGALASDSNLLFKPLPDPLSFTELEIGVVYIATKGSSIAYAMYEGTVQKLIGLIKGDLVFVTSYASIGSSTIVPDNVTVIHYDTISKLFFSGRWVSSTDYTYFKQDYTLGLALNGNVNINSDVETRPFYAPIEAGTSGQVLKSTGGVPTWTDMPTALTKTTISNPVLTASGGLCTWTATNSIGSTSVIVELYEGSSNTKVLADVSVTTANIVVKIASTSNIAAGTYRMVVIG